MFFFVATLLLAPNLLFADGSSENTCNSNPSYFQSASGGGSNTCSSSISGSDEVTKSETYQYSIANAVGDVRWCVEGVGVGIDAGGLVTLGGDACGAFSVSADDSYGTVSKDVRVTDAGKWQAIESCFCELCQYGSGRSTNICYSGRFKYEATHQIKVYGTVQQCLDNTANLCNPFCSSPCHPAANLCYSCVWLGYPRVCFDCIYEKKTYEWKCPTQKESVKVCAGGCEEGETRACYTGPAGTAGIGICQSGVQTCSSGQWGQCFGEVLPQEEICGDNLDNNCNGQTDEGCCSKTLQYVSGSGQSGYVCERLKEPFEVRIPNACDDVSVNWQVTSTPAGSSGASIAQSATTLEDSEIHSLAYLRLGSLPGSYSASAVCPECTSGSPQSFTASARCPDVPVYRQYDYPNDYYDTWCKIVDNSTPPKVIGKGICQCEKLDNSNPPKVIGAEVCRYESGNLSPNYRFKPNYVPYTIKAKGCALTSLAMVMGIYGSEALPDEWNRFMLSGGYTSKADVRWDVPPIIGLANLNLVKKSKNDYTPLSNSVMDGYLNKCMPVIVKVKNWKQKEDGTWFWNYHWVVVTGKSGDSYNINDPGYANRKTLSAHKYNNEIYGIVVYRNGGCQ